MDFAQTSIGHTDTNNLYYLDSAGQIGSVRSPTAARKGKKKVRKTAAEQQYDWSLPDCSQITSVTRKFR